MFASAGRPKRPADLFVHVARKGLEPPISLYVYVHFRNPTNILTNYMFFSHNTRPFTVIDCVVFWCMFDFK